MKKTLYGIFIGIIGIFGFFFLRKKPETSTLENDLENRANDLENEIKIVEEKEKELEKDGVKDLDDGDVKDYWKNQ